MANERSNMTICKSCGAEIAKSAKVCPNCGAKNKKPIYKRPWFIILIAVVVIGAVASLGGGGSDSGNDAGGSGDSGSATEEKKIEYTKVTADELSKALDENAASASDKYLDQYLEVEGKLQTIDSDGSYFTIVSLHDEWDILGVTCNIQNDEQLETVKKMKTGDVVIAKGQITEVGEIMSYTMTLDSIAAKE